MSAPEDEPKEHELNLSDIIYTLSPSPAPTVSQPLVANIPQPVPVLALVCRKTNQPLTPPPESVPAQSTASSQTQQLGNIHTSSSPRGFQPESPVFEVVVHTAPSTHTPGGGSPANNTQHVPPAILNSYLSSNTPSAASSASDTKQAHSTITHLTQQLTLLRHQRDLLSHQRDILIAQREEERARVDAQRVAWDRMAEALIAQNARESGTGWGGRKATEKMKFCCARRRNAS
ncbi:hypothetical protein BC835DRAFT_135618 [Cytidiella melzeri]|nr:hypothetical protein BC835DRAFT_135618 [Cytidiella melzeri]